MGLLHEIQAALLDDKVGVGTTLLKLRFLASKLGNNDLEEWVSHEAEGYPKDVPVPDYRKTSLVYSGTFSNGYQTLNKISVPTAIIRKYGGDSWVDFEIRDSLSIIDGMVSRAPEGLTIDTANLKLLIQEKVYDGLPCLELFAKLDIGAFARIQHSVRAKVLDLTLELEKRIPAAATIAIGKPVEGIGPTEAASVGNLTQQIFYGDVTNINSSGLAAQITISAIKGDAESLTRFLIEKGIPELDAKELSDIVASEVPEGADSPVGKRAQSWIADKLSKGASEVWGIGKAVATEVVKEAIKQYYGLK
jgi:AbiTii